MSTFSLPGPPQLPDGINSVWVGLWQRNVNLQSNAGILWRLTPPGTWESLHVPLVRDYAQTVVSNPGAVHGRRVATRHVGVMSHSEFSNATLVDLVAGPVGHTLNHDVEHLDLLRQPLVLTQSSYSIRRTS